MASVSKGDVYCLQLTEEEAKVLTIVFGAVGGSPSGKRGKIDAIHNALKEYGFDDYNIDCKTGSIHFKD